MDFCVVVEAGEHSCLDFFTWHIPSRCIRPLLPDPLTNVKIRDKLVSVGLQREGTQLAVTWASRHEARTIVVDVDRPGWHNELQHPADGWLQCTECVQVVPVGRGVGGVPVVPPALRRPQGPRKALHHSPNPPPHCCGGGGEGGEGRTRTEGECLARSAPAVQSFVCRQILISLAPFPSLCYPLYR